MNALLWPRVRFRQEHSNGTDTPECEVLVEVRCSAGWCGHPDAIIEIIEEGSGILLAQGRVDCAEEWALHRLPMEAAREHQATRVFTRVRCGDDSDATRPRLIFIRCTE